MGETVILISAEEQRALNWLRQAEKSATASKKPEGFLSKISALLAASFRLLSDLFGGCEWFRTTEAIECYRKAGYRFKIIKRWNQAGSAFTQAAMLCLKDMRKYEASSDFVEASNCFKHVDTLRTIDSLEQAVNLQEECGGFMISVAAKYHVTLAELYRFRDKTQCVRHYEKAATCYHDEYGKARDCLEKVAQYSIERNDYTRAAEIWEQEAERSGEIGVKYFANQEFLQAALCHLCIDPLNAQFAMDRYKEKFPPFGSSDEYKLMEKLLQCMVDSDVDGFDKVARVHRMVWIVNYGISKLIERAKKCCGETDLT